MQESTGRHFNPCCVHVSVATTPQKKVKAMASMYPVKPLPHKRENKVSVVGTKSKVQGRLLYPWSPVASQ